MLVCVAKPTRQPSGSSPGLAGTMNIGDSRVPTSAVNAPPTPNRALDQAVGLGRRMKDDVRVVQAEALEVVEHVVAVREREVDALDLCEAVEHSLAHTVQRELDRRAVVVAEGLEDRVAHARPGG